MRLICFLNHGSPSLEKSLETVGNYLKGGVDVIETDFPAEDPYLDSEYIKQRMFEALRKAPNYDSYMASVERILAKHPHAHLYILIYERTIVTIGIDKFVAFMKRNHLEEIILVGWEFPEVRQRLLDEKFKVSAFIEYHLPEDQIQVAMKTSGFIYLQATPAGKFHEKHRDLKSIIHYLKKERGLTNEINCGIGIHSIEQLKMVKAAGADGAFIGSQVLTLHDQSEKLIAKVKELKTAIAD